MIINGFETSLVYWVSSFYITGIYTVASIIVTGLLVVLPFRTKFGNQQA